jgi:HK97 family phage portal protein
LTVRNPFKRKALTATGGVTDALQNWGWMPWPSLGSGARDRVLAIYNRAQGASYSWMYQNSPAVRTVIDVIVRNIGQLDLRLYEELSEDERQPQPDHPAAVSLRYPNEYTSSDQFIRALFKDFLIYDNTYALLTPAASSQLNLAHIPSFMVEVQGSSIFAVENYKIWPQGAWTTAGSWGGAGTPKDFAPDQILHWHGENPADPRVGLSHLDTLRGVIAEDAALQQATVELAQSGLIEPTWIYRPLDAPSWSNAARAAFEEDVTNRTRRRTSKPVVLEEGMEMRSFGVSPRDAEMMEARRWMVSQVATEYGVPLGMVGLDPNIEAARSEFYSDVLPPYCEKFTRMLNQRILVRVYDFPEGCFEFNLDEKQQGDDRLRALTSATGRAVMLTNEARAKLNLPPVDGGDELVTPLNVVVGDNPKPSPQLMPVQQPGAPAQDGSYRSDQGAIGVPPKSVKQLDITAPPPAPALPPPPARVVQFHPRRAADIERQRHNVDLTTALVDRHVKRLERSLSAKARPNWGRFTKEFGADLHRTFRQIIDHEGALYAFKLGGQFDPDQTDHYVEAMAYGAAGALNDSVRQNVKQLGLDEAMSRAAQMVPVAGASFGSRATMWAREEAARQSPDYEQRQKTWVADTERHAEFDGLTVPIGDDWPEFAPGSQPNCQCTETIS